MLYDLITFDADDAGEVYDMWETSETLDLPENPSIGEICDAMKAIHRMASDWPVDRVGVDWEIYLRSETNRKIYLIRPKERS